MFKLLILCSCYHTNMPLFKFLVIIFSYIGFALAITLYTQNWSSVLHLEGPSCLHNDHNTLIVVRGHWARAEPPHCAESNNLYMGVPPIIYLLSIMHATCSMLHICTRTGYMCSLNSSYVLQLSFPLYLLIWLCHIALYSPLLYACSICYFWSSRIQKTPSSPLRGERK